MLIKHVFDNFYFVFAFSDFDWDALIAHFEYRCNWCVRLNGAIPCQCRKFWHMDLDRTSVHKVVHDKFVGVIIGLGAFMRR